MSALGRWLGFGPKTVQSPAPRPSSSSSDAVIDQAGQRRPDLDLSRPTRPWLTSTATPAKSNQLVPAGRPAQPRRAGPGLGELTGGGHLTEVRRAGPGVLTMAADQGAKVTVRSTQDPASQVHPAFKQRRKAARRARLASLGRWALALGIPAGLAVLLFASPVAAVRQGDIKVEGLGGAAKPAEVSEVLRPFVGLPLIRLNTGTVEARLEELPGVKLATVTRSWPTGLRVEVVPRVAAAVVADGAEFVILDAEGVQLERVAEAPPGLPQVVVPLNQKSRRALQSLLDVVASLPPELASQVDQASASSQDGVTLQLASGVTLMWGDASAPELKAAAVALLIEQGATWIDVTAPEMPVTK